MKNARGLGRKRDFRFFKWQTRDGTGGSTRTTIRVATAALKTSLLRVGWEPTGAREHDDGCDVISTAGVQARAPARASKSCRGARHLRIGRAGGTAPAPPSVCGSGEQSAPAPAPQTAGDFHHGSSRKRPFGACVPRMRASVCSVVRKRQTNRPFEDEFMLLQENYDLAFVKPLSLLGETSF